MNSQRHSSEETSNLSGVIVRSGARTCALRISDVSEIMRPLPVEPLAGAPEIVRGLSIIRGAPVPVVDLAALLGVNSRGGCTRFVAVRAGERRVALSVDAVVGIRELAPSLLNEMPPLLREANNELVEAVGRLDSDLLLVLKAGKIVPDKVWDLLALREAR